MTKQLYFKKLIIFRLYSEINALKDLFYIYQAIPSLRNRLKAMKEYHYTLIEMEYCTAIELIKELKCLAY